MKTTIIATTAMAAFCGCQNKAQIQKMEHIENRLMVLESNSDRLDSNMVHLDWQRTLDTLSNMDTQLMWIGCQETNRYKLDKLSEALTYLSMAESNMSYEIKTLDARVYALEPAGRRVALASPRPAAPAPVPAPVLKGGIPVNVYNAIESDAVKQWPSDYEMQAYQIKNQIEAYKKLHQ